MTFKEEFIRELKHVYDMALKHLPQGCEAVPFDWIWPQAALESNWGRSGVAKDCRNLFGTKGKHFGQGVCSKHKPPASEGPTPYTYFDSWVDCLVGYMRKVTHKGNHFYECYQVGLRNGKEAYWHCLETHEWDGKNYAAKIRAVSESTEAISATDQ